MTYSKCSEETKKKISISLKERKKSKEHIRKVVSSRIENGSYKHSEMTKEKMSVSRRGLPKTEKHKRKISEAKKGKPLTNKQLAHLKELTKLQIGVLLPLEHRKKMSFSQKKRHKENPNVYGFKIGNENPNWRGGIACEPYCQVWFDQEYKESIRQRDGYKCMKIGCPGNYRHLFLHLHHIDYNKKNCHPWNLITLCCSCHTKVNYNREYWINYFQNLMSEKYNYAYS